MLKTDSERITFAAVQSLVQFVLEHAVDYEWTLQGFGMLRTYVPNGGRINVWDSRYRVPNVSMIHTHPWNFDSIVVKGCLMNQRFYTSEPFVTPTHSCAIIKPGIGGGMREDLSPVYLCQFPGETYRAGEVYHQHASEIHISTPSESCVTFNNRERTGKDEARVYWPYGERWVDAIPREATKDEVRDIVTRALEAK